MQNGVGGCAGSCARVFEYVQVGRGIAPDSTRSHGITFGIVAAVDSTCGEMHAKDVMAAFLSAVVSANQESFALEKLELCLASPGFRTACSDGLLDHCHVTDPKGNVSRPLELAARRGYTAVVSELLALGASPALHSQVPFLVYISLGCLFSQCLRRAIVCALRPTEACTTGHQPFHPRGSA